VCAELIEAVRPEVIVELGAFLGASALHMAAVSRNLSLSPAILCIDDFRGWPAFRERFRRDVPPPRHGDALLLPQFMANVAAAGADAAARVLPLPFSTASALAALCGWGVYADLIEVDAGHDFHSAWADINLAWAVLRPGGVMFGHDYFTSADDRGGRRAVTLFAKVKGLTIHPHGQHWVLSPKPRGNGPRQRPVSGEYVLVAVAVDRDPGHALAIILRCGTRRVALHQLPACPCSYLQVQHPPPRSKADEKGCGVATILRSVPFNHHQSFSPALFFSNCA
jgi:hypothetical protein